MNTQTPNSIGSGSVRNTLHDTRPLTPTQPTTLARATELLNHVATAESHSFSLNSALFGGGSTGEGPRCEPTTLDGMLADACGRVASLCGDLATIKTRLGCSPE